MSQCMMPVVRDLRHLSHISGNRVCQYAHHFTVPLRILSISGFGGRRETNAFRAARALGEISPNSVLLSSLDEGSSLETTELLNNCKTGAFAVSSWSYEDAEDTVGVGHRS